MAMRRRDWQTGCSWRPHISEVGKLEIPCGAQALEGVLGFVIHGAARAFGNFGGFEFGDDLVDGARFRFDGKSNGGIAERAVTLAVVAEIQRNDRNVLAAR